MSVFRRDAVLSGLAPFLSGTQLQKAASLWDASFAQAPSPNLHKFAAAIVEGVAPACGHRDLHRALVDSVFMRGESTTSRDVAVPNERVGEKQVFELLFREFLARLSETAPEIGPIMRRGLVEKLPTLPLPPSSHGPLAEWLQGRRDLSSIELSPVGMRALLNTAYVIGCELRGPVVSDRLLALAIRATEAAPAARHVAPRSLL